MTLNSVSRPLPAPPIPDRPLGTLRLLRALLSNPVEIWTREHFEQPIVINAAVWGERVVVSDPTAIRHVLVDNAANYVRDDLQRRILRRVTGDSLFTAEGEEWQWQRRRLAPLFRRERLAEYCPAMTAAATATTARLASRHQSSADVSVEMAQASLDVLFRTILPSACDEDLKDVAASIRHFADGAGAVGLADLLGLPGWVPSLRRLWARPATRQVAHRARAIVARRANAVNRKDACEGGDLVSVLLAARHPKTGAGMDAGTIEDNVSTFLGAGSDTVASALTWSLYLLSRSSEVRATAEREADAAFASGPVTPATVDKLPFIRAVIEEAMRLYPPAPLLGRMALAEDVLCGRRIPAGSVILIAPWVVHRHRLLWDDPLAFDPGRFLPGRRERIDRFAYLPFGAGPRICIGMTFAMQEAVILLAHLLAAIRFEPMPGPPVRVFQCVTLRPQGGLRLRVDRRAPASRADT